MPPSFFYSRFWQPRGASSARPIPKETTESQMTRSMLTNGARLVVHQLHNCLRFDTVMSSTHLAYIPSSAMDEERADMLMELRDAHVVEVDYLEAYLDKGEDLTDAGLTKDHALFLLLINPSPLQADELSKLCDGLDKTADEVTRLNGAWTQYLEIYVTSGISEWHAHYTRDVEQPLKEEDDDGDNPLCAIRTSAATRFNEAPWQAPVITMTLLQKDTGEPDELYFVSIDDHDATVENALLTDRMRNHLLPSAAVDAAEDEADVIAHIDAPPNGTDVNVNDSAYGDNNNANHDD